MQTPINEDIDFDEDVGPIIHTVHALVGYSNPQTMKVGETLEHQHVIVLIDTDNTNNFMNSKVAD